MNMNLSNEELKKLLEAYLKRLDKMDKDRDQMMNKLKALSEMVKHLNLDIDELFKIMDAEKITISFDDSPMEDESIEGISIMIDEVKDDFKKEEYLSLIHSVVGEA